MDIAAETPRPSLKSLAAFALAEVLPDQKLAVVRTLRGEFGSLAMVGDGVNDAPALAASTVGIAMGVTGSDVGLETADVAVMADDLSKLPFLTRLGRQAVGVVRQNIGFSLGGHFH